MHTALRTRLVATDDTAVGFREPFTPAPAPDRTLAIAGLSIVAS
jgi:hypothetical protein